MQAIKRFFKGEEAATTIEYALIAVGIAIVIMVAAYFVGQYIKNAFTSISNCLGSGGS